MTSFSANWHFQLPNLTLVAMIYLLVLRGLAMLLLGSARTHTLVHALNRITDPVIDSIAVITPRAVPWGLVVVFAIVWLSVARALLYFGFSAAGLRIALG
jgi:hypothetical protein